MNNDKQPDFNIIEYHCITNGFMYRYGECYYIGGITGSYTDMVNAATEKYSTLNTNEYLAKLSELHGSYDGHKIDNVIHASEHGYLEIVKYLVEHGADVTADDNGAVKLASEHGNLDVVKYLVSQGADITADDNYAVKWSSVFGRLDVVKYLVEHGADITADDNFAVRYASQYGRIEVVKYLVELGADVSAKDGYAIDVANLNGHTEIVKYLESVQVSDNINISSIMKNHRIE